MALLSRLPSFLAPSPPTLLPATLPAPRALQPRFRTRGLTRRSCKAQVSQQVSQPADESSALPTQPSNSPTLADRRSVLLTASALPLATCKQASAALVQFPAAQLNNRYILIRAGESYTDAEKKVGRNPVWKTSQTSGLTKAGIKQVATQTVPAVKALGIAEDLCFIWASIWQSSYMTAEILAYSLNLGRSQIVPEYSFLDARGLGAYEGGDADLVEQQVQEFDDQDPTWRPLKGEDGTPHESLNDVLVRVRQVMSICETQYRGENILVVAPDSHVLSVLQAAALGVDLRQHQRFALPLGGVRELALASVSFDDSPKRYSCPNPPSCVA